MKIFKKIVSGVVCMATVFGGAAGFGGCFLDGDSGLAFHTFEEKGTKLYLEVENDVTNFSFDDEIIYKKDVTYKIYSDFNGLTVDKKKLLSNHTVELSEGENDYFIFEKNGKKEILHKVVIKRCKPKHRVVYMVGESEKDRELVAMAYVENGERAPKLKKTGYKNVEWDFDFATPITQETIIVGQGTEPITYKITYELGEGVNAEGNPTEYSLENFPNEPAAPTAPEGHVFVEWENSLTKEQEGKNILYAYGDMVLTAVWEDLSWQNYFTVSGNAVTGLTEQAKAQENLELTLPTMAGGEEITNIYPYAFADCANLTKVIIPKTVETIGNYAFKNCTNLQNVQMFEGLKTVSYNVFENCTALETIALPDSVERIETYAFRGCTALREVDMPTNLKSIGEYAFSDCTALSKIALPVNLRSIGNVAFQNCTAILALTIPRAVKTVGYSVFSGWTSAQTICCYLPEGVAPEGWSENWQNHSAAVLNIKG